MSRWLEVPDRPYELHASRQCDVRHGLGIPPTCRCPNSAIRFFVIAVPSPLPAKAESDWIVLNVCNEHASTLGEE